MKSVIGPWNVMLLALLVAWSGFAYTWHLERSPPDHDSPMQMVAELADHTGALEKACDHCCHGGAYSPALCSQALILTIGGTLAFDPAPDALLLTRSAPPLTPPPQA